MTAFLDLFSGIGGFALGAYRAGLRFDRHYFSEVDDYAIKVYQKHFPWAEPLGDIRNVDYAKLPGGEWLVTGGFPCQPYSVAGKRQGGEDKRDLWPECRRMLRELRPAIALFENVRGLLTSPGRERKGEFFNGVLSDISESGYACEWQVISAADAGAPHERKRVFIVANPDCGNGNTRMGVFKADKQEPVQERNNRVRAEYNKWMETVRKNAGKYNGLPGELDAIKGIGNAVVPQCVEMILCLSAFDLWRGLHSIFSVQ
jgi:DNA (cytosine-5)-methyltransferase 1